VVLFPAVVEALETFGREANGRCSGEFEAAGVEEIEERILENLVGVRVAILKGPRNLPQSKL
jgi:hypothetical protein